MQKKPTKQNVWLLHRQNYIETNVGLDWSIYVGNCIFFYIVFNPSNYTQNMRCLYVMLCQVFLRLYFIYFFVVSCFFVCLFIYFVAVLCFLSKKSTLAMTSQQNQGNSTQPTKPTNFQTLWELWLVYKTLKHETTNKKANNWLLIQAQRTFSVFCLYYQAYKQIKSKTNCHRIAWKSH